MSKASKYRTSHLWGYAAVLWALIFAFLHFVWAAGWYVLLPQEEARWSFSRPWFLVYDLVVAGACLLAVVVALALVQPWGRQVPPLILTSLAWGGTALLVLRSGGSVLQTGYLLATGRYVPRPMHLYEVWFCLGAVLFGVTLWRFHRAAPVSTSSRA